MSNSATSVMLPCPPQEFAEFISNLLGKPQTISNSIKGPFEIKNTDVQNVHSLLMQRIAQQNKASLAQFSAKIVYFDDSSVLLNTIEDFMTYNEIRPVACSALHLSWTFLVKFEDRQHPEKQQIELSFMSEKTPRMIDKDIPMVVLGNDTRGFIAYRIAHTARTWGYDIDALLSSHLKSLVHDIHPIKKWISNNDGKITLISFASVLLLSIATCLWATFAFTNGRKDAIQETQSLVSSAGSVSSEQVRFLLEAVATGVWERYLLFSVAFLLGSFVLSIVIAIWVSLTADNVPPSFLLLTSESEKRKKRIQGSLRKKGISFVFSILTALLIGVVGNYVYATLLSKLT